MQRKSEKGWGLFESFLAAMVIILILFRIVPRVERTHYGNVFKEIFGIEIKAAETINDEGRSIIQPIVTKRLLELRSTLSVLQKAKAEMLSLPETTSVEQAMNRLKELKEASTNINITCADLQRAEDSAKYFGFRVDLQSSPSVQQK